MTSNVSTALISAFGHDNHSMIISTESGLTIPYNVITSSMTAPTATSWKLLKFVEVLDLPSQSWFLLNVNQLGFYRVNYDEKNWRALISVLEENPDVFPSTTKAQLIDDSLNLARVGLMSYDTAIDLFIVLAHTETSYSTWNAAARNFLQLSFLLRPTEAYENFKVSD